MKSFDFLRSVLPHFVSFAWQYRGCAVCFALADTHATSASLDLLVPVVHPAFGSLAIELGFTQLASAYPMIDQADATATLQSMTAS